MVIQVKPQPIALRPLQCAGAFFARLSSMRASCSGVASLWYFAFHSSKGMPWMSARLGLVAGETGIADPVGKAVAAEACKAHQLDVLRIVAMLEVAHQSAESRCGGGVVQPGDVRGRVNTVTLVHILPIVLGL